MDAIFFIIAIYLLAGFENGKDIFELLSPFDLFGFIFWLYMGFLVLLLFVRPGPKKREEIKKNLEKEEGEFKVLCHKKPEMARNRASSDPTYMQYFYRKWLQEDELEHHLMLEIAIDIENNKKYLKRAKAALVKAKDKEEIERLEASIKQFERDIERDIKGLAKQGYDEHVQPLPPLTWDDVHEYIRENRTMLYPKKIDKDKDKDKDDKN